MRALVILSLLSVAGTFRVPNAAALSVGNVRKLVTGLEQKLATAARAGSSGTPTRSQPNSASSGSTTASSTQPPTSGTPLMEPIPEAREPGTVEPHGAIRERLQGREPRRQGAVYGPPKVTNIVRQGAFRTPGPSVGTISRQGGIYGPRDGDLGTGNHSTTKLARQGAIYRRFTFKDPKFTDPNTLLRGTTGNLTNEAIMQQLSNIGPKGDSTIAALVVPSDTSGNETPTGGSLSPGGDETPESSTSAAPETTEGSEPQSRPHRPLLRANTYPAARGLRPRVLTPTEVADLESKGIKVGAINAMRKQREEERQRREEAQRLQQEREQQLYASAVGGQ